MTITNQVMKRLVVDELHTVLAQPLTLTSRLTLERAMPHLYVQGSPTGSISLRIKAGSTTVSEKTIDLSEAMGLAGKTLANYHGYISFQFPKPPILKAGEYTIELEAQTYNFDDDAFVGWIKAPTDDTQSSLLTLPHDIRFVEIKAP